VSFPDLPVYDAFDVVVVGNGSAGCVAALAASRNGAKTLLVSQQGFLGGVSATGLPWLGFFDMYGQRIVNGIGEEIVRRLQKIPGGTSGHVVGDKWVNSNVTIDPPVYRCLLAEMMVEAGVQVLFNASAESVYQGQSSKIEGIIVGAKGGRQLIQAKTIIDATGDGDVAVSAGAKFELGRKSDGKTQAATLLFILDGINFEELKNYLRANPSQMRTSVETLEWAAYNVIGLWEFVKAATEAGEFPSGHSRVLMSTMPVPTQMAINTTRIESPDVITARGLSHTELTTQMQVLPLWRFFRKYVPGFQNCYIASIAHSVGIRESRHIVGEYTLTETDVNQGALFPDVIGRGGYDIDLHSPTKGEKFPGRHSKTQPYDIPYRALVPQVVPQMLIAGRLISASHEAAGSVRVIAQTMAIGQAAGTAAALALKAGVEPRNLDVRLLQQTLLDQGAELGPQFGGPGIPPNQVKPVGEAWLVAEPAH
jgi:ribulose 1,5-bisphosphate synthetase/thiazole synthase